MPIVRQKGVWKFDTAAGRLEILYRRIGRNELDAIQTCLAYVDAQNEYAEKDRTGSRCRRLRATDRQHRRQEGRAVLAASGGDESPLGELVAQASAEGYKVRGPGVRRITATTIAS